MCVCVLSRSRACVSVLLCLVPRFVTAKTSSAPGTADTADVSPQSATHPVIEHPQTAEQIWTKECHCCEPYSCCGTFLTILISLRCLASRIVYEDVAVFNGVFQAGYKQGALRCNH